MLTPCWFSGSPVFKFLVGGVKARCQNLLRFHSIKEGVEGVLQFLSSILPFIFSSHILLLILLSSVHLHIYYQYLPATIVL